MAHRTHYTRSSRGNGDPVACGSTVRGKCGVIEFGLFAAMGPEHPQQNGWQERAHLGIKTDATRSVTKLLFKHQGRFERFIDCHYSARPDQALGVTYPTERYQLSPRPKAKQALR
jgi:hypothetical protein